MPERSETGTERHPILATHVVRVDGSRKRELRVFCPSRDRSVPADVCRACTHCHAVVSDASGSREWICCTPPTHTGASADLGRTAGEAVREDAVAVEEDVLVRDIVALFAERRLRVVVVVDGEGHVAGVVQDSQLLPQIHAHAHRESITDSALVDWVLLAASRASAVMSVARPIPEAMSVREALDQMAGLRHQRLVVVDEEGAPVGVLVDVHALSALRANRSEP
jgi:CBS domain-containing protein